MNATDTAAPDVRLNCDTCGDLIDDPGRALVINRLTNDNVPHDFKIVHKNMDGRQCDPGANAGYIHNLELDAYLGPRGVLRLLSLISPGPAISTSNFESYQVDREEFAELFRRVQIPMYEQARRHFATARGREILAGANAVSAYSPGTLRDLVTITDE